MSLRSKSGRILQHFNSRNQRTSTLAAANQLGLRHRSTVLQSLHDNDLHPFRECKSCLLPVDFNPREQYPRWFVNKNIEDNDFRKDVLLHTWQHGNPRALCIRITISTGSGLVLLVTIWLALLPKRLTGDLYDVLAQLLYDVPLCIRRQMWFQQDGAG